MISLTNKENKIHREQKDCYICKKRFSINDISKNTIKFDIFVLTQENIEELILIFVI